MIEKKQFIPLAEQMETAKILADLDDLFVDLKRETMSKEEIRKVAQEIGKNISAFIEQHPDTNSNHFLFIGEVLTTRTILYALRNNKGVSVDYKQDPPSRYSGDTELYLQQEEERRKKNEEYKKGGILTVKYPVKDGSMEEVEMTLDELDAYLKPLRQSLLEELKNVVDPSVIRLIDRSVSKDGRVSRLHGGEILKLAFDWHPMYGSLDPEFKKEKNKALQYLFNLPERCPYLTYQIRASDFKTSAYEGTELHQEQAITTLDTILKQKSRPSLSQSVYYVTDVMRGAAFLIEKGLRLTDLTPFNIGINTVTDRGQLFDYDGLVTEKVVIEGYMTHLGFFPPERTPEPEIGGSQKQKKGVITQAEMVYEFGVTLKKVYDQYEVEIPQVVAQMLAHDPNERPTMLEAIQVLNKKDG